MNDHRGGENIGTLNWEQPFGGAVHVRGHMVKTEIGIMVFNKAVALRRQVIPAKILNASFRSVNQHFFEHHVFDAAAQNAATHKPGVDYPFQL
jgi:hypothetical protein